MQPEPILAPPAPRSAADAQLLSVDALISTCFAVWWKNLWRFFGLTVILVVVPVAVIGAGSATLLPSFLRAGARPDPRVFGLVAVAVLVPIVMSSLVLQVGGLTYGAVQHLAERPVRFGAMLSASFRWFLPLLGTALLTGLIVAGGLVLLVVPGIIFFYALHVTLPAAVAERLGPVDAIKRSWSLTEDHRGSIFFAGVLLGLIHFGIRWASQLLTHVPLLGSPAALFVQLLVMPLPGVLPAVAYHALRRMKEGTPADELATVFE